MADPITLAALRAFVRLSEPSLSPTGLRVAYVRTVRDFVHDRNVRSIVVVETAGGTRTVIDPGPFVSEPHWSPDGTRLAYVRRTTKDGKNQLVVTSLSGHSARIVTNAPNGVEHYAWSPDGKRFVYDTPDAEPNAAAARRHDDLFDVGNDGFLTDSPVVPSHLWLVSSAGGAARRLTHGTWSVFEADAPFAGGPSDPSWSADERTILINRDADAHSAATDRTSVAAVAVATGAVRELGPVRRYVYFPTFAPSGERYAYVRPHGPGPVSINDAVIADLASGGERDATALLDRDVSGIRFAGSALVALAQDHLLRTLVVAAPGSGLRRLWAGGLSVESFDTNASGRVAFVASGYGIPPELYVMTIARGTLRALTHENAVLRRYDYGRAERIEWTGPDGERSEGVVIHPPRERAGVRYPLLLWMHGGPEGEASGLGFGEEYDDGYDAGVLAAASGWYSFFPDYRGGNDFGNEHEHAIFGDPGAGPARDVMAGVADVEQRFPIDLKREAIGGHSYGGFMTAWIVGHETRFICAVVADGAVDWREAYDLSGAGNLSWTRDSLGGTPAQIPQLYHDGSPISYAGTMRTPMLIITGLADDVVPYTESWELYHALRDRNVSVRLVAIPTAVHTPSDPVRLEAYYRTVFAWYRAHVRN
jgi:dipeptidyl aminopeptidase/acylaminoacyl peptidase